MNPVTNSKFLGNKLKTFAMFSKRGKSKICNGVKDSKARSFVTIMVVIAISSLLLRFGIEKVIEITISQNESNAQGTLKLISAALENFAKDHLGAYPNNLSILTQSTPSYLDEDYTNKSTIKGYDFSCPRLETSGYSCTAVPVKCGLTGEMIYNVTTGSLFISEECSKKE